MQIEAHSNRWTNSKTFLNFPTITKFWCCNLQLVSYIYTLADFSKVGQIFFQFGLM